MRSATAQMLFLTPSRGISRRTRFRRAFRAGLARALLPTGTHPNPRSYVPSRSERLRLRPHFRQDLLRRHHTDAWRLTQSLLQLPHARSARPLVVSPTSQFPCPVTQSGPDASPAVFDIPLSRYFDGRLGMLFHLETDIVHHVFHLAGLHLALHAAQGDAYDIAVPQLEAWAFLAYIQP